MPFTGKFNQFNRIELLVITMNQRGVYGLFSGNTCIYIGSGDIRKRLFDHLNGDNPCITKHQPNKWVGEVFEGDPAELEAHLIKEYDPICNRQTG